MTRSAPPVVGLISLEPWDRVWRRNQYLVSELLEQGLVRQLVFVSPDSHAPVVDPEPLSGLRVVQASLRIPKRAGGSYELGRRLRRTVLADVDVLWINDPVVGRHCLPSAGRALYDVTDDWREVEAPPRIRRRIVRAEDVLARQSRTVVCSEELRRRWSDRYGVDATVVQNGIEVERWRDAQPRTLPGPGPHVGYVGTLHEQRLDIDLVRALAADPRIGTVHLVGPDAMSPPARARLQSVDGLRLHGPVDALDVPSWTCSFDVLLCPHLVTPFTLSLDAIKSYEYLASGRPVVATPTSGFQDLTHEQLTVTASDGFVDAVARRAGDPRRAVTHFPGSWSERARAFAEQLEKA